MTILRREIALLSILVMTIAWSDETPRFHTTANAADAISPIGGKHSIGVGFYTETIYPLSRPYSSDTATGKEDMRFQIPLGFGLEASYGISRHMEVSLTAALTILKHKTLETSELVAQKFMTKLSIASIQ
ncbi:MAG: hypothetical protein R3A80_10560 [Bdellovibrionota bacterium]